MAMALSYLNPVALYRSVPLPPRVVGLHKISNFRSSSSVLPLKALSAVPSCGKENDDDEGVSDFEFDIDDDHEGLSEIGFTEDNFDWWFPKMQALLEKYDVKTDRTDRIGSGGQILLNSRVYGFRSKFKLAVESGMLDERLGIDLVARAVNDLVTFGATTPVIFAETQFSTQGLDMEDLSKVVDGMKEACNECECPLVSCLQQDVWEWEAREWKARCSGANQNSPIAQNNKPKKAVDIDELECGGVARAYLWTKLLIDGKNIQVGDVLIGLPSSGAHSHGFSLVRRVLEQSGSSLRDNLPGHNITLGESLMAPTVIYVKQVIDIISKGSGVVKGIAHIKGGGLPGSIPPMLPEGLGAVIFNDSWVVPPIFKWIQEAGRIDEAEMRDTLNMGIGMVLVVSKESAVGILGDEKHVSYCIGEVVSGNGVRYG